MIRGTIGFDLQHVNCNLAGFSRQVVFWEAIAQADCLVRFAEETRCFRLHFSGRDSIGLHSIDLFLTERDWQLLIAESIDKAIGPVKDPT